ncbi:MAG: patatin-like phospholipase family protein [Prolixibacteraceae bacterium]|nr:patatin-like phospholipase family protein [Prolixibacteraceae bacterium]
MKSFLFKFLLLILMFAASYKIYSQDFSTEQFKKPPQGTAIIITGAAARIPQEAALLEELYKKGQLNDVVFIAGASSGALNTVMLNGILDKKITWEEYKNLLFSITNDSIFIRKGKKLPLDISPLKHYLTNVVNNKLGYYKIGDLPVASAISISDINLLKLVRRNYRLSNIRMNEESDPSLDLVQILMASTAFPIAFPKAKITGATTLPDDEFIDGGLVDDHVPFAGLLEFIDYRKQDVEKVFIVSRKSDRPELSEELLSVGINDKGLFDKLGISLDDFLKSAFLKGLKKFKENAPELAEKTYVYVPEFERSFLLLNFDNLKDQYDFTGKWAKNNEPVPLSVYLENNKE